VRRNRVTPLWDVKVASPQPTIDLDEARGRVVVDIGGGESLTFVHRSNCPTTSFFSLQHNHTSFSSIEKENLFRVNLTQEFSKTL
jgi:hypothetical protein